MSTPKDRTITHITAEAADWFTTIRGVTLTSAEREQFAQWLAESPVHVREYLGIAEVWGTLSGAAMWPDASVDELIAATRADANVVPLVAAANRSDTAAGAEQRRRPAYSRLAWIAATAVAVLGVALSIAPALWRGSEEYSTSLGEQRSVVLPDGSVVRLNTLSHMVVKFDEKQRLVELPTGEAFFRVAHDGGRAFKVVTPRAAIRAVGTQFNVYNREQGTQVAVVEGRVVVTEAAASTSGAALVLTAGQGTLVNATAIGEPQATGVNAATAWMQRRLAFDDASIDEVVNEFNRYNARRLEVSDPELAALRISGVFDADDSDALVKYLQRVQGVSARADGQRTVLTRARQ